MTQYSSINEKLSNFQRDKLKSATQNETGVTYHQRLSSNITSKSNDETKFPNRLLLNERQASEICNGFASKSSVDEKLLKI